MHLVFAPEKCFTYTLQFPCNFRKISQLLTCLILLLPNIITDFFLWSFLLSAFDVDNLSLFVFPDLLLLQPLILVFCWLLHFSLFSSDGVSFNSFFCRIFVSLLAVVVVSINRSCFVDDSFLNGFTLFFDILDLFL